MHMFGRIAYSLALAVWVGGGALYTFVLTPAIFGAFPRDTASAVIGAMMPHYFTTLLVAAGGALLLLPAAWPGWSRAVRVLTLALLVVAIAVQVGVRWRLYPEILAVKSRVASFESASVTPERARFRALHGVSMGLNMITLADGVALLALLALARRRVD